MFIKTRVATKTPRSLLINEGYELCEMGEQDEKVVALWGGERFNEVREVGWRDRRGGESSSVGQGATVERQGTNKGASESEGERDGSWKREKEGESECEGFRVRI